MSKESKTTIHPINEEIVVVEVAENKFLIGAFGMIVSSKEFISLEHATDYINSKPWELIINLCTLAFKKLQEYETEQKVLAEPERESTTEN